MKRIREEKDQPVGGAPLLSYITETSLLVHLLSYAWKDTFNLSLVCKRFAEIIRTSRPYWKAVGLFALKDIIPKEIILEVDFFFGLRPEDHPYSWMWCMFNNQYATKNRKDYLVFQFLQDRNRTERRILEVFWDHPNEPKNCFTQGLLVADFPGFVLKETFMRGRLFNAKDFLVQVGILRMRNGKWFDQWSYGEAYNKDRTRVWCGAVTFREMISGDYVYEPLEPFGDWVEASKYEQKPFYV